MIEISTELKVINNFSYLVDRFSACFLVKSSADFRNLAISLEYCSPKSARRAKRNIKINYIQLKMVYWKHYHVRVLDYLPN